MPVPTRSAKEKVFHRLFTIGVWVKGVDGILEIAGGLAFLAVGRTTLSNLIFSLTRQELIEDPDDRIANGLRHAFSHLSAGAKLFGSLYLLSHGVVKIALVAGMLRGKLWSFPTAMSILGVFIGYQIYRVCLHGSLGLVGLTMLDVIIVVLIWHEYRRARLGTSLPLAGKHKPG